MPKQYVVKDRVYFGEPLRLTSEQTSEMALPIARNIPFVLEWFRCHWDGYSAWYFEKYGTYPPNDAEMRAFFARTGGQA